MPGIVPRRFFAHPVARAAHRSLAARSRLIARAAVERAQTPRWDVIGIGRDTAPGYTNNPGFKLIRDKPHSPVGKGQHPYLRRMEDAVRHGQAVARILLQLKRWQPDAILVHPGWGDTLYAKDVFPDARLVHCCEWFYSCPRRPNIDPPCRLNRDPGLGAGIAGCRLWTTAPSPTN
jgi:Glycosyl transferase family 4 group